jgi:hypothetical protein
MDKKMKRPQRDDPKVIINVVKYILEDVKNYLEEYGDILDEEELEATRIDLEDAFKRHIYDDGYAVCKYLERGSYEGSSELVEIFDKAFSMVYSFQQKEIINWVEDNKIKPKLSVGDEISFQKREYEKTIVNGKIIEIKEETAEYFIFSKELGHTEGYGVTSSIYPIEYIDQFSKKEEQEQCLTQI